MTAILKSIGSVRFFAADSADVSVDHLLLWYGEGLDEVHEVVEGFLNI